MVIYVSVDDFAADLVEAESLAGLLRLKEAYFLIHCTDSANRPGDSSRFFAYDHKLQGEIYAKGREVIIPSCNRRVIGILDDDNPHYHIGIDSYLEQKRVPGMNLSAVIPLHHLAYGYVYYVLAESTTARANK